MTIYLKQSTISKVPVGPFCDATDGFTLETAVALATGEAGLIKSQGTSVVNIGTNTLSAHLGNGLYNLTLTASDTDTVGSAVISITDAAIRPIRVECDVLPANVYDSRYGTDLLQVDVEQVVGDATAAANQLAGLTGLQTGTVASGSTTTTITTGLTEATNDHYNGRTIVFTSGTLKGQAATIQDYFGASHNVIVSAMTDAPLNGDTFVIV